MKTALAVLVAASVASTQADAFCFAEAAERYGVSSDLLRAIARVESGLNPSAINTTHEGATGSVDLGLMQINSSHLPRLSIWGITRERLLHDACLNVMVGAWLLVQHMVRHGQDWNGIGSYNASCSKLKGDACAQARNSYAWKVYRRLPSAGGAATRFVAAASQPPVQAAQSAPILLAARVAP